MNNEFFRKRISKYIGYRFQERSVPFEIRQKVEEDGFTRYLIVYKGLELDDIWAYLLMPMGEGPFPAVLVHHQHAGQRHLGKSEVVGLAGEKWQAFGPELARRGIAVLAPDSICFEDRRKNRMGLEPDEENDFIQHYNEMCHRLVQGDNLMRKILEDAALAITLLWNHHRIDEGRIGVLGHSYGGTTALFQTALDRRISFACSSGAACTYQHKFRHGTGLEMALVIPGFAERFDLPDLVRCIAPRELLLVSATEDKYSKDADQIVENGKDVYQALEARSALCHKRYEGGHPLTEERFQFIVQWLVDQCNLK